MIENFFEQLSSYLLEDLSKNFWKNFESFEEDKNRLREEPKSISGLVEKKLGESFSKITFIYRNICEKIKVMEKEIQKDKNSRFRGRMKRELEILMRNTVFSKLNEIQELLFWYFVGHFNRYCEKLEGENEEGEGEEEEEEELEEEKEKIVEEEENFVEFCMQLKELGIISLTEEILNSILSHKIQMKIEEKCKGEYDGCLIDEMNRWMEVVLFKYIEIVFSKESEEIEKIISWKKKYLFHFYQSFVNLRVSELFDIIVEYPQSKESVKDLKLCLSKTNQFQHLTQSLKKVFKKRLLHPGANTFDIITQYISTIKVLLMIDPSGIALNRASHPIRKYLSNRKDTIRCIVKSLTDTESELFAELKKIDNISESEGNLKEEWEPEPIDSFQSSSQSSSKMNEKGDIITMLINIYGGKELFISEYKEMLSERLLSITDFDVSKEVKKEKEKKKKLIKEKKFIV